MQGDRNHLIFLGRTKSLKLAPNDDYAYFWKFREGVIAWLRAWINVSLAGQCYFNWPDQCYLAAHTDSIEW